MDSMVSNPLINGPGFALMLFVAMVLLQEVGRRIGKRWRERGVAEGGAGFGTVEGAVFALLGLMIAFTFSGAAERFDMRRQLIVEEANDISTAYLRLDLLAPDARASLQDKFRRYLDTRLAAYRALPDIKAALARLGEANTMQGEIWTEAVAACQTAPSPQAGMLLLPALNAMFDIATTRFGAGLLHPPPVIYFMLATLALACSLLAGIGMGSNKTRSWLHMVGFAAILVAGVYIITELEYPRLGAIRISAFDQFLVDVRTGMK